MGIVHVVALCMLYVLKPGTCIKSLQRFEISYVKSLRNIRIELLGSKASLLSINKQNCLVFVK